MAVSLSKNKSISLNKEANNLGIDKLYTVAVGMGWDLAGKAFDLDTWAYAFGPNCMKKSNLVFFGNKKDSSSLIRHMGDNLTGEGDGDDETININLSELPEKYSIILIGVTIYKGYNRGQHFKHVKNAFIRVYDTNTNKEICKYSDGFSTDPEVAKAVSMLFGAFVRKDNEWEFIALGRKLDMLEIPDAINILSGNNLKCLTTSIKNNNGGKQTMAVSLSKGGKVSLSKTAADAGITQSLTELIAGLGWSANKYSGGNAFDLDASAFLQGENGKVREDADFVFYKSEKRTADGRACDSAESVIHTGDNKTGEGDGDDEQLIIDLTKIPADVAKIALTVTIYEADVRNQNFGMVENSYVHIVDKASGTELLRYDLGEDFSVETAIVVAELYRHNGEWKFNAVGSGFSGGLGALCSNFGVEI